MAEIPEGSKDPSEALPEGYRFNWNNGRVLKEYQLIYVTEGTGYLETELESHQVKPGSVLLLYPEEWHRYKPSSDTGWKEYYIGFSGSYIRYLFNQSEILNNHPALLRIGFHDHILHLYHQVMDYARMDMPGFQFICSGLIVQLLGNILAIVKNKDFAEQDTENKIHYARMLIQQMFNKHIDMHDLALELNMGYSHFRKMFKKYSGESPLQYHNNIRLQRAKKMLTGTNKSIKLIASETGFQSVYYFTRLFKKKTGITPSEVRQEMEASEEEIQKMYSRSD
jgi:AraC-like DNA-binding protein